MSSVYEPDTDDLSFVQASEVPDVTARDRAYFDDDEKALEIDQSLDSKPDMSVIQQMNDVVTWRVDGLYNDDECEDPKTRRELVSEPPVFVLEKMSRRGNPYPITITPAVAETLADVFTRIDRRYRGLPERDEKAGSLYQQTVNWVLAHKGSSIVIAVLFLFVLLSQIFKF